MQIAVVTSQVPALYLWYVLAQRLLPSLTQVKVLEVYHMIVWQQC